MSDNISTKKIDDVLASFTKQMVLRNLSPRTRESYTRVIQEFFR